MNATIQQQTTGANMTAKTTKTDLQKIGGIAGLIEAASFLFGMVLMFTMLAPYGMGELNPVETVNFLAENQGIMYVWNQVIYVVFGIFLVPLALAIHERVKDGSPAVMQTATIFGIIWAGLVIASGMVFNLGVEQIVGLLPADPNLAAATWLPISAVMNGLGGGNETVGGIWILLISVAALRGGTLPKLLNYFGILISVAGLLTMIPMLNDMEAVFGLGCIVWFVWVGIVLLMGRK
ncbi:MAG: DUF4386 family protein [Caldilineaceae bacterium]